MNEYRVDVSYIARGIVSIDVQAENEEDAIRNAQIDAESAAFEELCFGNGRITSEVDDVTLIIEDV